MATSWWNRFLKSLSLVAAPRGPERVHLKVESLETRVVPTVSPFVDGSGVLQVTTNNNDDVTINHTVTGLGPTTLVNASQFPDFEFNRIHIQGGFDAVSILATSKPLGADDNNFFAVGNVASSNQPGTMQNIRASVSLGTANDVQLVDSGDPTGQNITLNVVNNVAQITGMAPAPISIAVQQGFLNRDVLGALELLGGHGRNTFNILDTPAAFIAFTNITVTNIFTGTAGDQVFVRGTHSEFLNIQGKARDFVTIGNNGNLANIQSPVSVSNPPSFTGLEVDGSAARSPQHVTLSVSGDFGFIDGLAPQEISYTVTDLSELLLQGDSQGGNTWNVLDTAGLFDGTEISTHGDTVNVLGTTGELQILGFGGVDRVNVGGDPSTTAGTLTNIFGEVDVDNLGGQRTQLTVNDRGDNSESHQVTLAGGDFQGTINVFGSAFGQSAPITYTGPGVASVEYLGSNAFDEFFVQSTATSTTIDLLGGSGNDEFVVSSPSRTLDAIRGLVLVDGGRGGNSSLVVDDGGASPGHSYVNVTGLIERSGDGGPQVVVEYFNIQHPFLIKNVGAAGPQAQDLALPRHVRVGAPATLTGQLVDDDPSQVLSLTVIWGDGWAPDVSTPDRDPFAVTHTYASPGVYTVQAIWTDSDGVSNAQDLTIRVGPPRPAVDAASGAGADPSVDAGSGSGSDASLVTGVDAYDALPGADKDHQGKK